MYPSPENQISFIDKLNDIDCPLNDTNSLSSFFNLKEILEKTSFDSIIYHYIPPSNRQMCLNPGDTDIVKFIIIPLRFPLKIIPLAISVSMNILLNDIISTGLGGSLFSSYNVFALNLKKSLILSSNIKLIIGLCGEISIIYPKVEKFGLILNE